MNFMLLLHKLSWSLFIMGDIGYWHQQGALPESDTWNQNYPFFKYVTSIHWLNSVCSLFFSLWHWARSERICANEINFGWNMLRRACLSLEPKSCSPAHCQLNYECPLLSYTRLLKEWFFRSTNACIFGQIILKHKQVDWSFVNRHMMVKMSFKLMNKCKNLICEVWFTKK